jgi:hypothetical protein
MRGSEGYHSGAKDAATTGIKAYDEPLAEAVYLLVF